MNWRELLARLNADPRLLQLVREGTSVEARRLREQLVSAYQHSMNNRNRAQLDAEFQRVAGKPFEQVARSTGRDAERRSTRMLLQGATFGFGDELVGLGAALMPGGRGYTEARDASRRSIAEARALAEPGESLVTEGIGGLLLPAVGAERAGAAVLARTGSRALAGAAGGATAGGIGGSLYGAGEADGGPGDRVRGAVRGGVAGAAGGAVIGAGTVMAPVAARAMARSMRQKTANQVGAVGRDIEGMLAARNRPPVESSSWDRDGIPPEWIREVDPMAGPTVTDVDRTVVDLHNANGGATVDPRTGESKAGRAVWAVAPSKTTERVLTQPPTPEDIAQYRQDFAELLSDPRNHIGTWFDESTGRHVLDVSGLYKSEVQAVRAAAAADQDAIFHLGRFETRPITAQDLANARTHADTRTAASRAARETAMLEGLTPAERTQYEGARPEARGRMLEVFSRMPSEESLANAMLAGSQQYGWYNAAGKAITQAFGPEDAPRFTALLAATSPRQSVQGNLSMSLQIWDRWNAAGRPTNPDAIRQLLPRDIMQARIPNALRSLTAAPEALVSPEALTQGGVLSGPKVDPFYANLMGETQRIVNDTHMAQVYGTEQASIGTPRVALPANARLRNAARVATQMSGVPFEPVNAQETVWSWKHDLSRRGGLLNPGGAAAERSAEEAFGLVGLPQETSAPGFGMLMSEQPYATQLQQIPGTRLPDPAPTPGIPGLDRSLIDQRSLIDLTRRIDAARRGQPLFSLTPMILGGSGLLGAAIRGQTDQQPVPAGLLR